MAKGGDQDPSEQYVIRSAVRTGLKREFCFALKSQSSLSPLLGRTRSSRTSFKKSEPCDFAPIPTELEAPVEIKVITYKRMRLRKFAPSSDNTADVAKSLNKLESPVLKDEPGGRLTIVEDGGDDMAHDDVPKSEQLDKPSQLEGPILDDKTVKRFTTVNDGSDDVMDRVYTSRRRFTRSMVNNSLDSTADMVKPEQLLKEAVEDGSADVALDDMAVADVALDDMAVADVALDDMVDQVYTSGRRTTRSMVNNNNNLEIKMPKIGVNADKVPSNLRELLGTGLLEGLSVKYSVPNGKLPVLNGVIKGINILCYCISCNGSKEVSPLKFEVHAGSVKKHPSDFIYLENGINLHTILKACKNVSLNNLQSTVKGLLGEQKSLICAKCKESFLSSKNDEFGSLCNSCLQSTPKAVSNVRTLRESSESSSSDYSPKKTSSVKTTTTVGQLTRKDLGLHKRIFELCEEGTLVDYCLLKKDKESDDIIRIKLLGGYVKDHGIFCYCCNSVISPSLFENHAGWASRRKPYHNIFTSDGDSLHSLAVKALKDRKISSEKHDDLCSICKDFGDLLLCDSCPRVYHLECLGLKSVPEGDYQCRYCKTSIKEGREKVKKCLQIATGKDTYIGGCVLCKETDFSKAIFDDRTILLCDQCEKEYHVGCLREHEMADLKKLPKGEWFCSNSCQNIHRTLKSIVLSGPQQINRPDFDLIKKKLSKKGLNEEDNLDLKWRLLSNKWKNDDSKIFFSSAVNIFHESFAPMVDAQTKQDIIPSMIYGRTFGDLDYSGMYCAILTKGESVVSVGLLRVMGAEAAELPLVATSIEYQGLGYFQALFSSVEKLLGNLKVKHFVLPAADEAFSIWTSKFGFSPITPDKLKKCLKGSQISVFEGTSMLHKTVPSLN